MSATTQKEDYEHIERPQSETVHCSKCKRDKLWETLDYKGIQLVEDGNKPDKLELRNCECGTTLGRWL